MSVDFQHPEYKQALPDWELVNDAVAGERQIKSRDIVELRRIRNHTDIVPKQKYLPMPNPNDTSLDNLLRYRQYLARAVFYNATGRTLWGLIGTAFKRTPQIELGNLEYLLKDADGSGVGLMQQVQATLAGVLQTGRAALWVDYPAAEGAASRADLEALRVRPSIIAYKADQVINWRTERVGAVHRLALVVIREQIEQVSDDGFEVEHVDQYRVLRMADGVYTVEVHREMEGGLQKVSEYVPRRGNGQTWDMIPFAFVGSRNNDPVVDPSPLLDLATLNIAHYRNSADYEDSAFFCGQPQPWIAGLDDHWRDWLTENGIYIGSRAPLLLPEGGEFGLAQAQPNTLVKEAMEQKEQQMIALGARLVSKGQAIKTATEAQADAESEHSVLSLIVENVSEAYTAALNWAGEYANATGDYFLEMSRDFLDYQMDAQRITAIVAAWQGGAIPTSDLLTSFKRAGLIDPEKSDEDLLDELVEQNVDVPLIDAESDAN